MSGRMSLCGMIFLLLTLISCTQPSNVGVYDGLDLRSQAQELESSVHWAQELESSVLTETVGGADGIIKSISSDSSIIFASGKEKEYEPVYPEIEGFSILNTSMLPETARIVLENFCNAIINGTSADACFARNSIYVLVVFRYDLAKYNAGKFSEYILGEPFSSPTIIQCPVRFLKKDGTPMDFAVYLKPDDMCRICAIEYLKGGQ